jgi:hypothetical protein
MALQSSRYQVVFTDSVNGGEPGQIQWASGTSCATNVRLYDSYPLLYSSALRCPFSRTRLSSDVQTAAAIFSLLNDYRLSKGMAPFGLINPWLYEYGILGFKDITSGSNPGCDTGGFSAIVGWDPVRPARPCLFVFDFADSEPHRSPA